MTVTVCKECRYFAGELQDPGTNQVFIQCAVLPMPINRPTDVPCLIQGFGDGMGDYAENFVDILLSKLTGVVIPIVARGEESH